MSNEDETQDKSVRGLATPNVRPQEDMAVLATVIAALAPLESEVRLRIFRTLLTFFDVSLSPAGAGAPATRHSFADNDPIAAPPRSQGAGPSFSEDRAQTPKAFLLEKRPQTDVERIACLAYYLTHYRDQAHFKTLDLSKLNTEAAQVKFGNAAKAVDNAANAHFLIQAGQGKKQISAIGELYVQALPDRIAAKQAASEVRQRKARAKSRGRPSNGDKSSVNSDTDDGN